jgi:hypothetical protein
MPPRSLAGALAKVQVPDTAPGAGVRIAEGLVRRLLMQLQLNEAECAAARTELTADIAMMQRRVLEERLRMARGVLGRAAAAGDAWLYRPEPQRRPRP